MIDPAMVRPGRLDKLLYVDLPTASERVDILKTHTTRTPIDEGAWPEITDIVTSSSCDGFSGADIAALVREAATLALRSALESIGAFERDTLETVADTSSVKVTVDHFRLAAKKTLPSVSREQRNKYERMRDKYAGVPTKGRRMKEEVAEAAGIPGAGTVADVGAGAGGDVKTDGDLMS